MGNLDDPRSILVAGDQQPGIDEPLQPRPGCGRQARPAHGPAHVLPVFVDPHEGEERCAQRCLVGVLGGQAVEHLVGRLRDRGVETPEPRPVLLHGDPAVATVRLVQLPEGEREQRQRVRGSGVLEQRLYEARPEGQAGDLRRPLDDFGEPVGPDRGQGHRLVGQSSQGRVGLELREGVGAHRAQCQDGPARGGEALVEGAQERGRGRRFRGQEALLKLVHHQEHAGLGSTRCRPKVGEEVEQSPPAGHRVGCLLGRLQHVRELPGRPVLARLGERTPQRDGELAGRVTEGAHRGHDDPAGPVARQARQQAGPGERRLAAAGGAEDHDEPVAAELLQPAEGVDAVADLLVAAEEDGCVLLVEGEQAGVGRAAAVPREGVVRVQAGTAQPVEQPLIAILGIAGDVDDLARGEDRVDVAGPDLDGGDVLAERLGMGDLGEAPVRGHGVLAAQDDECATRPQPRVELDLPVASGGDAVGRVEVEEDRAVPGCLQACPHLQCDRGVPAAVAEEDGTHPRQPTRG